MSSDESIQLIVKTTVNISQQAIADVVCTAMEQACGYWARVVNESTTDGEYYNRFFKGGWVEFRELDGRSIHRLDISTIQEGLKLLAEKYPHYFADIMNDDHDADTADAFLQLCLLKDIVYG